MYKTSFFSGQKKGFSHLKVNSHTIQKKKLDIFH
jgi:hypothetical protein